MDLAYDHIQEEALNPDETSENGPPQEEASLKTLNNDFQEAYKAISSSPWGAKLGGFFGSVVKQGETVYKEAQSELSAVGEEATKGFTDLRSSIINRTRSLSLNASPVTATSSTEKGADVTPTNEKSTGSEQALQESEGVLARLKTEAAKRLKEIQKAEDAADEALLKFGTNIRNFLAEAVSIAPPVDGAKEGNTVLFESKDAQGKRVIHTTRFDAQLHVIHSTLDNFKKDPDSPDYDPWAKEFNTEAKTADISKDLENYDELRASMEKLVPDQISYADFWKRYYFLRRGIETAEALRRDLLKAATTEEEVGWDEESEDESPSKSIAKPKAGEGRPVSVESSTTIQPVKAAAQPEIKISEPRKSNDEKSQPDSEGSYDVVGATSGAPSQAPGSPKESRKGEESEEEDWE